MFTAVADHLRAGRDAVSYYVKRTDSNHCQILEALASCGWYCLDTSRAGFGAPDCLAVRAGRLVPIENQGSFEAAERPTTDTGRARGTRGAFAAAGVPIVVVVMSVEEAMALQ